VVNRSHGFGNLWGFPETWLFCGRGKGSGELTGKRIAQKLFSSLILWQGGRILAD
jgi:hypothetical protein